MHYAGCFHLEPVKACGWLLKTCGVQQEVAAGAVNVPLVQGPGAGLMVCPCMITSEGLEGGSGSPCWGEFGPVSCPPGECSN